MDNKNKKSNTVLTALGGAAIGAGIATTGTVLLQNKKNRTRVIKMVKDLKKYAKKYKDDAEKTLEHQKDKAEDYLEDVETAAPTIKKDINDQIRAKVL